jgi:hypothetical protein
MAKKYDTSGGRNPYDDIRSVVSISNTDRRGYEIFLDEMISNYIWMMEVHVCLEDKK